MKQERHTQKEEREGRGEWRAGRREGGRGNSVEKGLAVRREKEEAVKLEKDVSAGPDYRGLWSSQTFYHPRHQNQPGSHHKTAGGGLSTAQVQGSDSRTPSSGPCSPGRQGNLRPSGQKAGSTRPSAAAPMFPCSLAWSTPSWLEPWPDPPQGAWAQSLTHLFLSPKRHQHPLLAHTVSLILFLCMILIYILHHLEHTHK